MKPRTYAIGCYGKIFKQLQVLLTRAQNKLGPARFALLEKQAVFVFEQMSELRDRHVRLVDHIHELLGESEPPPPPPPRRSTRPPAHRNVVRFTFHPPKRRR